MVITMSETTDLRHLKKWLGRGEISEIMQEVGIGTRVQASNIIAGRCQNWLFVEKFLERVRRNKALKEETLTI